MKICYSLKEENVRCLGMDLLLSILKLWLVLMSQVKALFFSFSVPHKEHSHWPAGVYRNALSDHKFNNYPMSFCVLPPVPLACAIYACCHLNWATTNAEL